MRSSSCGMTRTITDLLRMWSAPQKSQALTASISATFLRRLATGFLAVAFVAAACAAASRSAASLARRNARSRADFFRSAFRRCSYSDMAACSSCFLNKASAAFEDFVLIVPNFHDTAVVSHADCWDGFRKYLERLVPKGARGPPDRDSRPGISQRRKKRRTSREHGYQI